MTPWTVCSNAFWSHVLGVELYSGFDADGVWLNENSEGNIGA